MFFLKRSFRDLRKCTFLRLSFRDLRKCTFLKRSWTILWNPNKFVNFHVRKGPISSKNLHQPFLTQTNFLDDTLAQEVSRPFLIGVLSTISQKTLSNLFSVFYISHTWHIFYYFLLFNTTSFSDKNWVYLFWLCKHGTSPAH